MIETGFLLLILKKIIANRENSIKKRIKYRQIFENRKIQNLLHWEKK